MKAILFKLKKIFAIIIMISNILLSGCWSSREINTLAIAVCTGIDKTDNGYLITHQVINPKAVALKKNVNQAPVIVYSAEDKDIFQAYRKMTTECPRKIYNSHLRMVVLGEEVAKEGIEKILDIYARDHEFRTDFFFAIAKGTTANNVLSILTTLEVIPGVEMYYSLKTSESAWAPTKSIKIVELINDLLADGKNPVITGIEVTQGVSDSNSTNALMKTNAIKRLKYDSLGVFKKDKLVGWLSEDEAKGFNYIIGNVENTVGYSYLNNDVKITFEATKVSSSIKASLKNGKPSIDVEIRVTQNVGAVTGDFDVSKEENKKTLNDISKQKITILCEEALKKTQNELETDIFGFGEAIHRKYPKLWDKLKDNWNNEFKDIQVNFTVKVETNQLGQITKPFFVKEK